jgi:hypothetical protein
MRPLRQAGRASEVGCRAWAPARWSGSFHRAGLLLCALWGLSAACLASGESIPSALQLQSTPALCDQGSAIADLDGDGRPDLAIVTAEGWGPRGFRYQIEIQLTTGVGAKSFSVSAKRGGLRVVPRDVDGDGDLDLVISSAWTLAPVGVWINNGHGGFTQGNLTAYSPSILTGGPYTFSDTTHEKFQATVPESYRSCINFPGGSYFCNELLCEQLALRMVGANPPRRAVGRLQVRAPPQPFPLPAT